MNAQKQLFTLYKKLYEQRELLAQGPSMTIDISTVTEKTMPQDQVAKEIRAVISYLLGLRDVDAVSIPEAIKICNKAYAEQKFWKDVILDYLSYKNKIESEQIAQEAKSLLNEAKNMLEQIQQVETSFQTNVSRFANKIKSAGFPVDATKLMRNYINMAGYDPDKAYATLIKNPAYFSPIIRTDKNGMEIMTASQASAANKNLASFLKGLKA